MIYHFFLKHRNSAYIFEILNGLKSASLGLIISAAAAIILIALYGTSSVELNSAYAALDWTALIVFLSALFVIRKWKISPIIIMLLSGIAGVIFYI